MKGKTTKRDDRRIKLASALILGAMGAAATNPALAQSVQQISDERIEFNIAAQPLSGALSEFARQARVNALYFSDDLRGLSSLPLRGSYTRQQALDLLLARSGYNGHINGGNLVLAQEQSSRPQRESAASGANATQAADPAENTSRGEAEIIVTGTRIRGAPPVGANVIGLDHAQIEQTGRTTVQDVLQTLPQVFPGSESGLTRLTSIVGGDNLALGSSVDLRGLGSGATLTLLNGRRLAPAGFGTFVDISAIPLAAVERVEVLADGASAIYGADAVGGVVNIIMRRDLDHAVTSARYGAADGADNIQLSHVFGKSWSGGSLIVGYEYGHQDALAGADRSFAANSDLRPFGGSDFSRSPSSPGNILQIGATPVHLGIPAGQDGLTLTAAQLLPNLNHQNGNQDGFLTPEQESHSLFGSLRHDLNDRVSLFVDILGSYREAHAQKPQLGGTLVVPETNYYRQQNGLFADQGPIVLSYFFGNDFGPILSDASARTLSLASGAEFQLFSDWRLEASIGYGKHVDRLDTANAADSAPIRAAFASSDPATAFNPFGNGGDTPAAILDRLTFQQHVANDSELVTYALRADGGFFDLPGGRARAAFGVERRRQTFRISWQEVHGGVSSMVPTQAPGDRSTDALYAELYLPVVQRAALSLSLRRETSSDFGESVTPKIGMQWRALTDLTFRAAWGTSFKAPDFTQLLGGTGISIISLPASLDPNATGDSTGVLDINGANPHLRPEQAETWTAGFDFRPTWLDGFQFSATYFDVDYSDRIDSPGFILDAFQHPARYAGYFIRNPTPEQIAAALAITSNVSGIVPPDGIEVIFDERLSNLASLRVRGVDLSTSYTLPTAFGRLSLFASASGLLEFSRQNNPSLPSNHLLDTIFNPIDWRVRGGVALDTGDWRLGLVVNYTDAYRDNLSTPNREIDAWTTYDTRITRRFNVRADGAATELSLDVRNLTDVDPPFANNSMGIGFDSVNASPLGRVVMIEARQQW